MVFERVQPKLAVYTHVMRIGNSAPSVDQSVLEMRQTYQGPLQVGEDLMCFLIGDGAVVTCPGAP